MTNLVNNRRLVLDAAADRVERQRVLVDSLQQRRLPTQQAVSLLAILEKVLATMQQVELDRPSDIIRAFSQNHLLGRLSAEDIACLSGSAELVSYPEGHVFLAPNQPLDRVWFIESGIVAAIGGGGPHSVEVATIGREGLVGAEIVLGTRLAPLEYVALSGGQALQVSASALAIASPALLDTLMRFNAALRVQSAAAAVASAAFNIGPRLARSLLMYQDRADGDELGLTHTTLAEMLAVRRAGVTDAIHRLEGDHLVLAQRSSIVVRDRQGLRQRAGSSYGPAETAYRNLFPGTPSDTGTMTPEPRLPSHGGMESRL